jgi:hypothetical protein
MVVEALSSFGYGHKGGDNKMVHGLRQLSDHAQEATQLWAEKSRLWWMYMQWLPNISLTAVGVSMGAVVFLLLLISHPFCVEGQVTPNFIHWKPLKTISHDSQIEVNPKRRWVAQLGDEWGWLRVWELKGDLTIGEKVLDIGGREGQGFFVRGIKWVGDRLLMTVIEGYDTYWEWDREIKRVPWRVKWLLFDPQTRQIRDLGVNEDLLDAKLFAHPSEDKVLIVKLRTSYADWQIEIVQMPLEPFTKPKVIRKLSFPQELVGRYLYPVGWTAGGQHFWAIGTDQHGLPKLFAVRADGSIKRLTPDDHELYPALWREDGIRVDPISAGEMEGVVTPNGEYAVLMMFPKREREHVCIGYYSQERLERKRVLLDVNRPYPSCLKPLGICRLVGMVPDGRRLVIQEGWFAPYGEKKRVWVWDTQAGTVKPLAQVGWIEKVYGWIGTEWMVVKMRGELIQVEIEQLERTAPEIVVDIGGEKKVEQETFEYGLLQVP